MDDVPLWLHTKIPKETQWAHGQELKNITHVFVVSQNPSKFLEIVVTRSSLIQRLGFDRMGIDGLWQWLGAQGVWVCVYTT